MPEYQTLIDGGRETPVRDPVVCDACGEESRETSETPGGLTLRPDCSGWCEECEDTLALDDMLIGPDEARRCEECHDEIFGGCNNCGDIHDRSELCDGPGGHYQYCNDCFCELYDQCGGCGEILYADELRYHEFHGESYCSDCYRDPSEWDYGTAPTATTYVEIGSKRKFGVELETSQSDDCARIREHTRFGAKPDGSTDGMEFVSPPMKSDSGLAEIRKFCELADDNGFDIDHTCGYHLHCDISSFSTPKLKRVLRAYYRTYTAWCDFVTGSRAGNTYCGAFSWTLKDLERESDVSYLTDGRYEWVNIHSVPKFGTLEIRLHSATLDAEKVCNWVKAHLRFIDTVAKLSCEQIDALFRECSGKERFERLALTWGDDELREFYLARVKKFGAPWARGGTDEEKERRREAQRQRMERPEGESSPRVMDFAMNWVNTVAAQPEPDCVLGEVDDLCGPTQVMSEAPISTVDARREARLESGHPQSVAYNLGHFESFQQFWAGIEREMRERERERERARNS